MRSELDAIDHVVRGALNAAILNLQLLSTSVGRDEAARPLIDRASAELRRVAEVLLPAGLRIVGLEIGELRRVDLGQVVEQTLARPGLDRTVAASGSWPTVVGDPALLAMAIEHLVSNAVAATPPAGPMPHISASASPDGTVALVVRNTCAGGVPPLAADGSPAARGHLGGLATVVRIARLHRGTLTFERQDGELVARLSIGAAPQSFAEGDLGPRAEDSPARQSVGRR